MSLQYGQQTFAYPKGLWFKTTWKNNVHRHDLSMLSDNKVFISIMFCVMFRGFLSFDIHAVSKNMFLTSFIFSFV
jgi:hypothetical protein